MPKAFVIMPFAGEFSAVYDQFVKLTLTQRGFDVFRADDLQHQRSILQDIVEAITLSDLIIADLTGGNENVFYELGLAHAMGKPVVLLAQDVDDVPFDLRGYRLVTYSTHFTEIAEAIQKLGQIADGFLRGDIKFGNPVSDYYVRIPKETPLPVASGVIPDGVSPGSNPAQPSQSEEGERNGGGLIDHLADLEGGFEALTEILGDVTRRTNHIARIVETHSTQFSNMQSGVHGRKISRNLAKEIDRFAAEMKDDNDKYSDVASRTNNSLEFLIAGFAAFPTDDTGKRDEILQDLITNLKTMVSSSRDGRESFAQLQFTMESTPKIERFLSRAMTRASFEVGRMVGNIDQTVASGVRAIDLGTRLLDDVKGAA